MIDSIASSEPSSSAKSTSPATEPPLASVLLVEDDHLFATEVRSYLEKNRFQVLVRRDGERLEELIQEEQFEIVILDWMLPGRDGLSLCRALRPLTSSLLLILTARVGERYEVQALESGADDYLAKPLRPRVLLARLRAHLRRHPLIASGSAEQHQTSTQTESIHCGALEIERRQRLVTVSGESLRLTDSEYELLLFLAERSGYVVSREELSYSLRGVRYDGLDRSIDLRISRLRRKLHSALPEQEVIRSVRGVGYMMVELP